MSNEAKSLLHYVEQLKAGYSFDAEWTLNTVRTYAAYLIAHGL